MTLVSDFEFPVSYAPKASIPAADEILGGTLVVRIDDLDLFSAKSCWGTAATADIEIDWDETGHEIASITILSDGDADWMLTKWEHPRFVSWSATIAGLNQRILNAIDDAVSSEADAVRHQRDAA